MKDKSYKTAITRRKLSLPAQKFKPWLEGRVLDFGCGKGFDANDLGCDKYDSHFEPIFPDKQYSTVMMIYVLNTKEYPSAVLKVAKELVLPGGLIMIATRTPIEVRARAKEAGWKARGRGWITGSGTFQRGMSAGELKGLLPDYQVVDFGSGKFSYIIARKPR